MKTQIIQIYRNDDLISIRDKMGWSQTQRILLIWPGQHTILKSQLEFTLLKRFASRSGAELGIVTADERLQDSAARAGIPTFTALHSAQNAVIKKDHAPVPTLQGRISRTDLEVLRNEAHPNPSHRVDRRIYRVTSFLASILSIFLLGVFILPKAEISIIPQTKTQSMVFPLIIFPPGSTGPLTFGVLPAEVHEVVVEGEKMIETTGAATIPDHAAYGEIQLTNASDQSVVLPGQMVVATSGGFPVKFIIQLNNQLTLEPGKSILLTAQAIESGTSGNLPPGSLVIFDGALNESLKINNPTATVGGTDASVPSPSADDIQVLRESLVEQLKPVALSALQAQLSTGDVLITPTLQLIETVEENPKPAVGDPGKHVTLHLRLRFEAQVVTQQALQKIAVPALDAETSARYIPVQNSILVSTSPTAAEEDQQDNTAVQIERKLQAVVDPGNIMNQIKGRLVSKAEKLIETSTYAVEAIHFRTTPGWWPWLPLLTMRMTLVNP